MKKQIAIQTFNLSMVYEKKRGYALKDANIEILKGDIHGFIGPNGAGKTTLIKLLLGGFKPKKGRIQIFGYPNNSIKAKQLIGYVPEKSSFIKGHRETSKNYLLDLAIMNGMSKKTAMNRINELVKDLKITKEMLGKSPYKFSTGQKKKILVAQALLKQPKVLILDEPAASLDPIARFTLLKLLKRLNKKYGITIFISSHILSELQQFVTGWTIINNGKILLNQSMSLQHSKKPICEIKCDDVTKLKLLLRCFKSKIEENKKALVVYLNNDDEIQKLQKIISESRLLIHSFINVSFNLQSLYEKYVKK